MNEVKFRAWNSEESQMIEWLAIRQTAFNRDSFALMYDVFTNPKFILQQYTGLKDKNGKEIYEGDIVKCGYDTGKVIFVAGCFMVEWVDDKESYREFLFSRKGVYTRKDDEEFTVIGNLYENPELLKQ